MNGLRIRPRMTLGSAAFLLLMAGANAAGQVDTVGTLVDVGSFTVNMPDIDDWDVAVDKEKGTVEFTRGKQQLLSLFSSGAGGATSIFVFKNRPQGGAPGLWLMTERETADHFRTIETAGLLQQPQMHIVSIDTDAVFIEDRHYYRLLYRARFGKGESESVLYVYFPPEFSRTKEFFGVLISESYVANSIFASKDLEQVRPLLRSLRTTGSGSTLPGAAGDLLRAASGGDSTKVRLLVEGGVDVNVAPPKGRGPLALASLHGHESIVRFLVDRGALVNPDGVEEVHAPLASAMLAREVRIAEYLLTKGARATARPDDQLPPLARAITMHFDSSFVSALLDSGADPNLCRMWTPLMHSANEGLKPVAEALIAHGAIVDGAGIDGETALMLALKNNHADIAAMLLARGAKPEIVANDGRTPLMCAALGGDTTSMVRLLDMGARVEAKCRTGETALAHAAMMGHLGCTRLLLRHGAAVDAPNGVGATPLDIAILHEHVDCAELLLENGADINSRTNQGITPLMFAAVKGDSAAVRLLIDRGADLDLESESGDTALDLADHMDLDKIVAILEEAAKKK